MLGVLWDVGPLAAMENRSEERIEDQKKRPCQTALLPITLLCSHTEASASFMCERYKMYLNSLKAEKDNSGKTVSSDMFSFISLPGEQKEGAATMPLSPFQELSRVKPDLKDCMLVSEYVIKRSATMDLEEKSAQFEIEYRARQKLKEKEKSSNLS